MTTAVDRLQEIWETPSFLALKLEAVDHKKIGFRYMVTAFSFFLASGLLAMLMRAQLFSPNEHLLTAAQYDQLFTMHGTTMIFFFATPMLFGFGNYFVPLMIGARDMAYPRLNAFGYWVFLFAGIFIYSSFLVGSPPDGGWFAYVPLTGITYSPNVNIDFWVVGIIFLTISTTVGAINFIVTIFKLRAPGMSISRMPLFCWAILATSCAVMFALPPLTSGNLMLLSDRKLHTQFFNPDTGGNVLLWQHLFWFFGHPDVYIIFLPAVGLVSTVIPVFSRRPIASYTLMAVATMTIGFIGFGVWVHHMFATGLPQLSLAFFGAASLLITFPSAVQIFAWIATIWDGKVVWRTPMLFMIGFMVVFIMGGITGVMFAVVPFDWQATDTYFVVAHFHYVLFGGAVFPIFGGLYYFLPKITGRMLNEKLGITSFALIFVGFNLTFFPQHIVGLMGMPRRIYTYPADLGWTAYNMASTIGSFILALGILVFVIDYILSLQHGELAGDDPWGANTLEWATTSPPAEYNFAKIPIVTSRDPLWDNTALFDRGLLADPPKGEVRETIGTSVLDADVEHTMEMPAESPAPLIVAFGLLLLAYSVLPDLTWVDIIIAIVAGITIVWGLLTWLWPEKPKHPEQKEPEGMNNVGWWGMALLVLTEAVLFSTLLTSYLYLRSGNDIWPLGGIEKPKLLEPAIGTALLLGSSIPMFWAEWGIKRDSQLLLRSGLFLAWLLGVGFIVLTAHEYIHEEFSINTNVYASLFFFITGLHLLHVIGGVTLNGYAQVRAWLGHYTARSHLSMSNVALYWHFVDVVWIGVVSVVYMSPHILS
ncbi:MAG TPA: cytochrome c oxidase subunit I [Dehalococcoidia bacterium]|nr:cytochrome c oxidase subunit I [Dehalococcoidia bacterium]